MYQTNNTINTKEIKKALNNSDKDFREAFVNAISKMFNINERVKLNENIRYGSAMYSSNPARIFETKSLFNNDLLHDIEKARTAFIKLNAETKKINGSSENVFPYLAKGKIEDTLSVCYQFTQFMYERIPAQQANLQNVLNVIEDLMEEAC